MNNQNQEQKTVPELTPEQKPKPKPKSKLPNWASILIIVIAAVIVVGLVSWAGYELFKPAPSKLPEGGEVEEDVTSPEIISTEPAEESTIGRIDSIKVTFDEALDVNTVNIDNFYPLWGIQDKVPGKVSYDESKFQIIFTPDQPIIAQSTTTRSAVTIVITESIKDKNGNALKERKTYNIYLLKDETANWKTYQNEEFGYEIKYPKDWTYKEDSPPRLVSFDSAFKDKGVFLIIVHDNKEELPLLEFLDKQYSEGIGISPPTEEHMVIIDSHSAVRYSYPSYPIDPSFIEKVYFANDDKVYEIKRESYENDSNFQLENFNQILSTFKFLK